MLKTNIKITYDLDRETKFAIRDQWLKWVHIDEDSHQNMCLKRIVNGNTKLADLKDMEEHFISVIEQQIELTTAALSEINEAKVRSSENLRIQKMLKNTLEDKLYTLTKDEHDFRYLVGKIEGEMQCSYLIN